MRIVLMLSLLWTLPTLSSAQAPTGSISGKLGYPSEEIPILRVCAISSAASGDTRCIRTRKNQSGYRISNLRPGTYFVVAYPKPESEYGKGFAGAFTKKVSCGMKKSCDDHSLIPIAVSAGRNTAGADPLDWYAPPGLTFPSEPLE